jgi:hypothetical protein
VRGSAEDVVGRVFEKKFIARKVIVVTSFPALRKKALEFDEKSR